MAGYWSTEPVDNTYRPRQNASARGSLGTPDGQGWRTGVPKALPGEGKGKASTTPTGTGVAPPTLAGGQAFRDGAGGPAGPDDHGYASGPGILESWFNQRANGTDPAYQYTMGRGMDAVDTRMAAGGSFNSGARGQQLSDFASNMGAQRMGQLDSLAAGASGEYQGRLNSMMMQQLGLSGGQAGTASTYDQAVANAIATGNTQQLQMFLNKAGVDAASTQALINNIMAGASLANGGPPKKS